MGIGWIGLKGWGDEEVGGLIKEVGKGWEGLVGDLRVSGFWFGEEICFC